MVLLRASSSYTTAATPGNVVIPKPAGVVLNDVMVAAISVNGGTGSTITPPSGWVLIERLNNGTALALALYVKTAGASEGSSYTFTTAGLNGVGIIRAYYNDAAPLRAWLSTALGAVTVSSANHATPSIYSTSSDVVVVETFAVAAQATWTPPGSATELQDITTTFGANDVALSGADENQATKWTATGAKTATASVAGVGLTHILTIAQNGVTRPAMTTINYEDNAQSPGGVTYAEADFSLAFPLLWADGGGAPKTYNITANINNGDGVGTAPTTWTSGDVTLKFAAGFAPSTSSVGITTRWTKWGTIVNGANGEPIGYDGPQVWIGANMTIGGLMDLGGVKVRSTPGTTSRVFIQSAVAEGSRAVDCHFTTLGTLAVGTSTTAFGKVRRLTWVGLGTGTNGRCVQYNAPDTDVATFYCPGGTSGKIDTGGFVTMKNARFIGPAADLRTVAGGFQLNPSWSEDGIPSQFDNEEMFVSFALVIRAGGVRVAGVLVAVYDKNARLVVSGTTDANGSLPTFTAAQSVRFSTQTVTFENAIAVVAINPGSLTEEYQGPWRVVVDGTPVGFPDSVFYIEAPYRVFLTTEKAYLPMAFTLDLENALKEGPTAAFYAVPGGGALGATIAFVDESNPGLSPGGVTAWAWDFGDPGSGANNTSALQNPSHVYADAGTYTVTLQVTTALGVDTLVRSDMIAIVAGGGGATPPGPTDPASYYGADDILPALEAVGQVVTYTSLSTFGKFDERSVEVLDGEGGSSTWGIERVLRIPTDAFPGLTVGSLIGVDGGTRYVVEIRTLIDGTSELLLADEAG